MAHGANAVYEATIASFATASSALDLGRSWDKVYLLIPAMTSQTALHIQASETSSGTFRRVYHTTVNSATVATNVYTIASAVTNAFVPIPAGHRFMKVEATAIISFSANFKIICSD